MATIINDGNFHNLITFYLENKQKLPRDLRELLLNNWDVSKVTNMSNTFNLRKTFNEYIGDWDVRNVINMSKMFYGCATFNQPLDGWNDKVSNVNNMGSMFAGCLRFNQPLNGWIVSKVKNMSYMFFRCRVFNQPLNGWNVSSVTNMHQMFCECTRFNQPLNDWNVSSVTNMSNMFDNCVAFNQPLNVWNVSSVTDMYGMFAECRVFNQPLNGWNVSRVTNMGFMFEGCVAFNQPLNEWDVHSVTHMIQMFQGCITFNMPLNDWNVSSVTDMRDMFYGCDSFNQPLNDWNVSSVTNMHQMFYGCDSFNQPLNDWDVSSVTNMYGMFKGCVSFNQPLNDWDVRSVTNMQNMFEECRVFNQPLNSWDVRNVTDMSNMFRNCINFNQNISNWTINTDNIARMYENCGISQQNKAVRRAPRPISPRALVYGVNMNEGRANEVHDRFNALNIQAITQFINVFNRTHPINAKILEGDNIEPPYLFTPLSRFIHNSELFVPTEKRANKEKLQRVSRLIQGYESATPEDRRLLRAIVEFVSKQNDDFIQQYILILSDECLNAYGANQTSCAAGAYERSITTLDAVAKVLITEDKYRDNKTYNQLNRLFPKINFVEVVQKWSDTYLEGGPHHNELEVLNNEERKEHFIEFMREKYEVAGLYTPIIEKQIQEEATQYEQMGVFERLVFGGKIKRNTKKNGKRQKTEKRKGGKKRNTEKKVKNETQKRK